MHSSSDAPLPDLTKHLHAALRALRRAESADTPLQDLVWFRVVQREGSYPTPREATRHLILRALELLAANREEMAALLRMRFLEGCTVFQVAYRLGLAESTIHRYQQLALQELTAIVAEQERRARLTLQQHLAARLPLASTSQLVGIETLRDRLLSLAHTASPPWIISIEGIGGIGKTSLANAVLRRVVERGLFDEVAWISMQSAQLTMTGELIATAAPPATSDGLIRRLVELFMPEALQDRNPTPASLYNLLHARLKAAPHFIVIDNLETVRDLEAFMPLLQKLAGPSKFLLTTRTRLHARWEAYSIAVPELSQTDALRLVRQTAQATNLPDVVVASEATLLPIYRAVGGNPLGLRLVVGQLHLFALSAVLQDLQMAQGLAVENLYAFIYRRAWDALNEPGRQTLLATALLPLEGAPLAMLEGISQLPDHALRSALQTLARLNLVEVHGDLHQRVYAIHNLTRTFLLEQVAKWM